MSRVHLHDENTLKFDASEELLPSARAEDPLGLHRAVEVEDAFDVVRLMNTPGLDVNRMNKEGLTPLMIASRLGLTKMVEVLLSSGAGRIDVNAVDDAGRTALIWAAQRNNADTVTSLLKAGARADVADHFGETAVIAAARGGVHGALNAILEHDMPAGERTLILNARNLQGRTAAILAVEGAHADALGVLKHAGADLSQKSPQQESVVELALKRRDIPCLNVLLGHGENAPNLMNLGGLRPRFIRDAIDLHQWDALRTLSRHNFNFRDELEAYLLQKENRRPGPICYTDPDEAMEWEPPALMLAVEFNMNEAAEILIDFGDLVDGVNCFSETPLMRALEMNNPEAVRILMKAGANPDLESVKYECAFYYASRYGDMARFDELMAWRPDSQLLHQRIWRGAQGAICADRAESLTSLMETYVRRERELGAPVPGFDTPVKDSGHTACTLAVGLCKPKALQVLVDAKENLEHPAYRERSLLFMAASGGYTEIVKILLLAGVSIAEEGSMTPLEIAKYRGHTAVAELLLERSTRVVHA